MDKLAKPKLFENDNWKKEKDKKKSKKKKSIFGYDDINPIIDATGLFEEFTRSRILNYITLFGDPVEL